MNGIKQAERKSAGHGNGKPVETAAPHNEKPQTRSSRKERFETSSGLEIRRVYTPADVQDINERQEIGLPGEYPFTRGITLDMYREKLWYIAQYSGFGSAKDANERYKKLLDAGQTMLIIAMDLPTQIGLDPDDPRVLGEVGRVGVSLSSLADFEALFDGILLNRARMCTVANGIGPIALSWFLALCEKQGLDRDQVIVNIQNDPFKEFTGRGTWIYPVRAHIRLATDALAYAAENLPTWEPMNVCGTHMRWAGANAVQEVAFAISNTLCYIEETLKKGLTIDDISHKIELHLNAGHDLFEEVAKFRATRRIWAKLMKERYHAKEQHSMAVRISVYTAGYTLTAQQPLNNVVRIAMQNLSAVLGGVQYINTASYDEALATPQADAAILSTRTQQILAYECGLTDTVDPLGGSYYVEALTQELESKIWSLLDYIDETGGAIAAVESGFYDREMAEGAYRYYRGIESGEQVVVGVNQFTQQEELGVPIFRPKPDVHAEQKRRVQELRARRNNLQVQAALEGVVEEAKNSRNVVPAVLAAVKSYATIGEICDAFRSVYGEHKEHLVHF